MKENVKFRVKNDGDIIRAFDYTLKNEVEVCVAIIVCPH